MKADLRKQKLQERRADRRRDRVKLIAGSIFAVAAIVFALGSFVPRDGASSETADTEAFRRIGASELKTLIGRGAVTVIDVRDIDSYLAAHIPGALQIPLSRVEGEIPYLPKDRMIVTYCTCPAEESSGSAVQILARGGITNAAALQGGLDAWRNAGGAIETGYPPR